MSSWAQLLELEPDIVVVAVEQRGHQYRTAKDDASFYYVYVFSFRKNMSTGRGREDRYAYGQMGLWSNT